MGRDTSYGPLRVAGTCGTVPTVWEGAGAGSTLKGITRRPFPDLRYAVDGGAVATGWSHAPGRESDGDWAFAAEG